MSDVIHAVVEPVKLALTGLYTIFRDDEIAIFVSLALVFWAILLYLWFRIIRMAPQFRAIRRVSQTVTGSANKELFYSDYASIDQAFKTERLVAHAWTKFEETLIKPEANEPKIIRNTSRPSSYFNVNTAIESGLPLPFYHAVPNYFVGIGLLFTFFGLVAALYFASQGVAETASVSDAQTALRKLLNVASFKFLTSISGILCSLALSIFIKRDVHHLQVAFDALNECLEARMDAVTPEAIALMHLREQRAQTYQLQRFNTDFAIQLADAIEKRFTNSLGSALSTALAPLTKRIEDMSSSIGSANEDALKKMLTDFTGTLHQTAGTEIKSA